MPTSRCSGQGAARCLHCRNRRAVRAPPTHVGAPSACHRMSTSCHHDHRLCCESAACAWHGVMHGARHHARCCGAKSVTAEGLWFRSPAQPHHHHAYPLELGSVGVGCAVQRKHSRAGTVLTASRTILRESARQAEPWHTPRRVANPMPYLYLRSGKIRPQILVPPLVQIPAWGTCVRACHPPPGPRRFGSRLGPRTPPGKERFFLAITFLRGLCITEQL